VASQGGAKGGAETRLDLRIQILVIAKLAKGTADKLLEANLEHELGGPGDELTQKVAGESGLEVLCERLLHLNARWYPLYGVVGSFLGPLGTIRCATGRIPYAAPFLH